MSNRIPLSRLTSAAVSHAVQGVGDTISAPFRVMKLGVSKPQVFFDGRPKLKLGDKARGQAVLAGQFTRFGQSLDIGHSGDPWTVAAPSERFADWLHRFSWMEDLCVLTDKSAPVRARFLIDRWIDVYGHYNVFAWDVDITAERLFYWLSLWSPALSTDSLGDKAATRRAVALRQMKYLRQHYKRTSAGLPRLRAAISLAIGGLRLQNKADGYLNRALDWIDDEIDLQILPDGAHVSRSPEQTLAAFEMLRVLDDLLDAKDVARSKTMGRAIDRLTPIVDFFRAGDGGLVCFNGAGEGDKKRIAKIIKASGLNHKPFGYCPHSGYQRIAQNGTVLMIDSGSDPAVPFDECAHLSPLSFELSTAEGRLISSCGWSAEQPTRWQAAMRATAAHSTLVLDDSSAGRIVDGGIKERLFGAVIADGVGPVKAKRKEQIDGIWVVGSHGGYRADYGLSHRRRFYMSPNGHDVRGEDSLYVPLGSTPLRRDEIPFTIRFHLHPTVKVTLAQDQKSALLIQAGSVGWRLRTDGGPLTIEPSFYLGYGSKPVKTEQLVIHGSAFGDSDGETRSNRVRWSLSRLEARK